MMYKNKLAVALKSAGRVLREFEDTVYIPFGSEYTILIKNLNSVRAQVRVWVDGTEASEGCALVIQPNSELELERFIKNANLNEGNRFKFIERTESIEEHRGIKIDDGLIRVEFQFEKIQPVPNYDDFTKWKEYQRGKEDGKREARQWPYYYPYTYDTWYTVGTGTPLTNGQTITSTSLLRGAGTSCGSIQAQAYNLSSTPTSSEAVPTPTSVSDVGITVPGSVSNQTFTSVSSFSLETEKHTMVLKILGETEQGKKVEKAVTVKTKQKCVTCGHTNKMSAKFCSKCGTSLTIV